MWGGESSGLCQRLGGKDSAEAKHFSPNGNAETVEGGKMQDMRYVALALEWAVPNHQCPS